MQDERPQVPAPPEGLRPAQLGIVLLGRVIVGHVSATLVDLAMRGFLGIAEVRGDAGADWVLTDLRTQVVGGDPPLGFEVALLDRLFSGKPEVRLSKIGDALLPALNQFRAQLGRDAIRHGWLRRWHRDERTPRGEQLLTQIHRFRRELRALAAAGDSGALAALEPYAMIFGLVPSRVIETGADDTDGARPRDTETVWSQSDRFAQGWVACMVLSAPNAGHGTGPAQPGDFVHDWSSPHDHGHGGHGNDSGHGGYGGGYGDHGGGHHSGFDGHGGH